MKIYKASYNQNNSRFGDRAGSQCMSNCFTYLHAAFLDKIGYPPNQETLNAILDEGTALDRRVTNDLVAKNPGTAPHVFRLNTEIRRLINTQFGSTYHVLSKPINGTYVSRTLDNITYPGVTDLVKLVLQKAPCYLIITVDAFTRAISSTRTRELYLFDPHPTRLESMAAIYHCERPDELVSLIAPNESDRSDFYYDAATVYFVSAGSVTDENTLLQRIMTTYPNDPDIDLPIARPQKRPLRRNAPEVQTVATIAKRQRKNLKIKSEVNDKVLAMLDYAIKLEGMIDDLLESVGPYVIRAPPTAGWIIYGENGLPFERDFLQDRIYHILGCHLDKFLRLEPRRTDEMEIDRNRPAEQYYRRIMLKYFQSFVGFDKQLDEFIDILQKHSLDILTLYKSYLINKRDQSEYSQLDKLLAAKTLAVFRRLSKQHGAEVVRWIKRVLKAIDKLPPKETKEALDSFLINNRFPIDDDSFVCLDEQSKSDVSFEIQLKETELIRKIETQTQEFFKLKNTIFSHLISLLEVDGAGETKRKRPLSTTVEQVLRKLDSKAADALRYFTVETIRDIQESLDGQLEDIISEHYNRIITGHLPKKELTEYMSKVDAMIAATAELEAFGLCDTEEELVPLQRLYDTASVLHSGRHRYDSSYCSQSTRDLRKLYDEFVQRLERDDARIEDMLSEVEFAIRDLQANGPTTTLELINDQLRDLNAADVSRIRKADERLRRINDTVKKLRIEDTAIRQFVNGISYLTLPTVTQINKHVHLKDSLREDAQLRSQFDDIMKTILVTMTKKLAAREFPKNDVFASIKHLLNQRHPPGPDVIILENASELLEKLTKELKNTASATKQDKIQTLTSAIQFFADNKDGFTTMMNHGVGKDELTGIYQNLKKDLGVAVMELRELEWEKSVKEFKPSSAQELHDCLATAPSDRVRDKLKPELEKRLRNSLESQYREQMAIKDKNVRDVRDKAENELKRIADAFSAMTPSTVSMIDMEITQGMIVNIEEDTNSILEPFNRNMRSALTKLNGLLSSTRTALLTIMLRGEQPRLTETDPLTEKRLGHLHDLAYNVADKIPDLLNEETKDVLQTAITRIDFINKILRSWQTPDEIFSGSEFASDYSKYKDARHQLDLAHAKTRDDIARDTARYVQEITSADKPVTKIPKVAVADVPQKSLKDEIDAMKPPFSTDLKDRLRNVSSSLRDTTTLANNEIQTQAEFKNQTLKSSQARWRDLVQRHRLGAPDMDIPIDKLIASPTETLYSLLKQTEGTTYSAAAKQIRWICDFCSDVMANALDVLTPETGSYMSDISVRAQQLLSATEQKLKIYATCETTANLLETESYGQRVGELVDTLESSLNELDPKRISGGEKRYQQLKSLISERRMELNVLEDCETLIGKYFELIEDVKRFRYGFHFTQIDNIIQNLRQEFVAILPTKSLTRHPAIVRFPKPSDDTVPIDEGPDAMKAYISTFISGLAAIQKRVHEQSAYLNNMSTQQSLLQISASDVTLPSDDLTTAIPVPVTLTRLKLSTRTATMYGVEDVFGVRTTTNTTGTPIELAVPYHNSITKLFSIRTAEDIKNIMDATALVPPDTVTTRYRAIKTAHAIMQSVKTFWEQIRDYDLGDSLHNKLESTARETNILHNLKLFLYLLVIAWTSAYEEPKKPRMPLRDSGRHETSMAISEEDLLLTHVALFPNRLLGTCSTPTPVALGMLIQTLDKDTFTEAINVHAVPPTGAAEDLPAFCVDPKEWKEFDLSSELWNHNLLVQLCGKKQGGGTVIPPKLLQYEIALVTFPPNIIHHLWLQFKPAFAEDFKTMYDMVLELHRDFLDRNDVVVRPREDGDPETLPAGDKVTAKISVTSSPGQKRLLDQFLSQNSVLDYIVGSYLFGVQMVCAADGGYVLSKNRRLLLKQLSNTHIDDDFNTILNSRLFDSDIILRETWTGEVLEHAWFRAQILILQEHVMLHKSAESIPLVIYDLHTNGNASALKRTPVEISHDIIVSVDNRFSVPVSHEIIETTEEDSTLFSETPLDVEFLYISPPKEKPQEPQTDTVPTSSLSVPVFHQKTITDITPKDQVTTLEAEIAVPNFTEEPYVSLHKRLSFAIDALKDIRQDINDLIQEIHEGVKRLRIMYVY
ncbi:GP48 [Caviid betaherpesvirus 2]|uniref:GP48 n=1 Tax=Guinea pig cytomegalovirus (strain 22122) TaxID=103920 RepID=E9RH63_GPCMV|nr:GP48 [Caviid betaherpesvirus 2]AGE11525.1 GP48 [Caviid betaherpesvirus 2]AIL83913.1 GP48 [BAC cloning vector GPN13BACdenovo_preserved(MM)]BAJ78515.1 GP48 [Caviid betaherpesvirus 2]